MADTVTEATIRESLANVYDPELGFSIIELGLVRDIHVSDLAVQVSMTLTTPACPYAPALIAATEAAIKHVSEGREPIVQLVWEPPWNPREDASEEVLDAFGIWA